MSSPFIEQIKVRRTIYALGDQVSHTPEQLTTLIQDAIKHSPSSFNSQSSRAVILFGAQHHKLWDIVKAELKKIVPPEAYPQSEAKVDGSFRAGFGTVLFFEDTDVIRICSKNSPSTPTTSPSGRNMPPASPSLRSGPP